jgi:hypothetical protein
MADTRRSAYSDSDTRGLPGWLKLTGIIVAIVVLLAVTMMLLMGGGGISHLPPPH